MKKVKTIDEYIDSTKETFAYPILKRVREVILNTDPDIEEKIKWGSPSFEYKGLMMSAGAFKNFVGVWFHKGALLNDPGNLLEASTEDTKALRKYIIPSLDDLDEAGLRSLILEAMQVNDKGLQVEGYNEANDKFSHSDFLEAALKTNPRAKAGFEALTNYKKKEYVELIETAKQEATKERRLQKALKLLEQGKGLNDKYR